MFRSLYLSPGRAYIRGRGGPYLLLADCASVCWALYRWQGPPLSCQPSLGCIVRGLTVCPLLQVRGRCTHCHGCGGEWTLWVLTLLVGLFGHLMPCAHCLVAWAVSQGW